MKHLILIGVLLATMGSAAAAQELLGGDPELPLLAENDLDLELLLEDRADWLPTELPTVPVQEEWAPPPGLGVRVGYLRAPDAEAGTWFAGIQGQYSFDRMFALRAYIEFHQDSYEDVVIGTVTTDVDVTYYPVSVSLFFTPIDFGKNKQLGLVAGAGWYFTRFDYDDPTLDDETENSFGGHVGIGGMLWVGEQFAFGADILWHFLDVDKDNLGDERSDYIEFGFSFIYSFGK